MVTSHTGYYSAYLYKSLKGAEWQKATLATALFYPAVTFAVILCARAATQTAAAPPTHRRCAALRRAAGGKKESGEERTGRAQAAARS
jgi:hypothetical protein